MYPSQRTRHDVRDSSDGLTALAHRLAELTVGDAPLTVACLSLTRFTVGRCWDTVAKRALPAHSGTTRRRVFNVDRPVVHPIVEESGEERSNSAQSGPLPQAIPGGSDSSAVKRVLMSREARAVFKVLSRSLRSESLSAQRFLSLPQRMEGSPRRGFSLRWRYTLVGGQPP